MLKITWVRRFVEACEMFFRPSGAWWILFEFLTHGLRDGLRSFARDGAEAEGGPVCKRSCNGWSFLKYERAPGDWVRLDELRK